MVRLALVRFQPDSIEGCTHSSVVLSDIVNVPPDRTVSVERTADGVAVTVAGTAPGATTPTAVTATIETSANGGDDLLVATGNTPEVNAWRPDIAATGGLGERLLLPIAEDVAHARVRVTEVEAVASDGPGGWAAPLAGRIVFTDFISVPAL